MEEHIINETLARMERRAEIALKHATEDTNPETAGEWYDQWTGEKYRVTAWRPLPEPYRGC